MAGIVRDDGHVISLMHDLRHPSAVHRLTAWIKRGADLNRMVPALSAYMGKFASAQRTAMSLTPERFRPSSINRVRVEVRNDGGQSGSDKVPDRTVRILAQNARRSAREAALRRKSRMDRFSGPEDQMVQVSYCRVTRLLRVPLARGSPGQCPRGSQQRSVEPLPSSRAEDWRPRAKAGCSPGYVLGPT